MNVLKFKIVKVLLLSAVILLFCFLLTHNKVLFVCILFVLIMLSYSYAVSSLVKSGGVKYGSDREV